MKQSIIIVIIGLGAMLLLVWATSTPHKMEFNPPKKKKATTQYAEPEMPSLKDVQLVKHSSDTKYGTLYVYARVRNNSKYLARYVEANVTFYDANGTIVGTAMGNCLNVASGAENTITAIGDQVENAERYEVVIADATFHY